MWLIMASNVCPDDAIGPPSRVRYNAATAAGRDILSGRCGSVSADGDSRVCGVDINQCGPTDDGYEFICGALCAFSVPVSIAGAEAECEAHRGHRISRRRDLPNRNIPFRKLCIGLCSGSESGQP